MSSCLGFHVPAVRRLVHGNGTGHSYSMISQASGVPEFKTHKEYKERVAEMYNKYSETYDSGTWHDEIGGKLIRGCGMRKGDAVLDMCAGTGISSMIAAKLVGETGQVVGVDFAEKMLDVAREKSKDSRNVEMVSGDVEKIAFPHGSFDWVICCAAFLWLTDYKETLRRWRKFLVPQGGIALHAFWERSFISGFALQTAAAKHGVEITVHQPTGTEDKMIKLLNDAGFSDVRIDRYEVGSWMPLEDALKKWDGMVREEFPLSAPLLQVSDDVRGAIKKDYEKYLRENSSDKGVWEDRTTFMTYARNSNT